MGRDTDEVQGDRGVPEGGDPILEGLYRRAREEVLARARPPLSTYRVQLHRGFRFEDARRLVPYWQKLGVTDLYSSPYLKAQPGSNHGYDVIDHQQVNPEVGTEEEHAALCAALREAGMGQLLDVVPNHMGIERDNALWFDVLENGPSSIYAKFFDVDWDPVKDELRDKVLLPILGDAYGVVLERGELKLSFDPERGAFWVNYWEHRFPLAPRQYHGPLSLRLNELSKDLDPENLDFVELQSILTAIEHLPSRTETDRGRVLERHREKEVIKRRLRALVRRCPRVATHIEENLELLNGRQGDARSFDALHELLEHCSYRLAHWRTAGEEINYRRFFDINALAAIRVEDDEVFEEAHAKVMRWIGEGKVTGLRIDHPDGLFDPTAYFLRLQERAFLEVAKRLYLDERPERADAWPDVCARLRDLYREELDSQPDSPLRKPLYVVVEKIQGGRERMPDSWAVHGTTGYRFANATTGIFVKRTHESALTSIYERFVGEKTDFQRLLYEKKRLILSVSMSSEINVLARELNRISEMNRKSRDFTLISLRRALAEFIAHFPVYRTYVDGWRPELDDRDVQYIDWTIRRAKQKDPTTNVRIYDFLRDILLRRYPAHLDERERATMLRFVMKLQQLTGPVMAKGLEDTVFYVYNRLVALNEVGGEPERFGLPLHTFHLRNQERAEKWPSAMLGSSTHDTKRSEDVRARMVAISEVPERWAVNVERWAMLNARHKSWVGEERAPSPNDEYLLYQTLVGAWPMGERHSAEELDALRHRIKDYMAKATKEAKVHTSWVNPDAAYDEAMAVFVDRLLDADESRDFLDALTSFKRSIERAGQVNALAQVVLKLASPGVSDFYQGTELWDLSLVDPDNRRPIDFALRERLLDALDARAAKDLPGLAAEVAANMDDGRIKLLVTSRGLRMRRERPELFRRGDYQPLDVVGPRSENVIAFVRRQGDDALICVVPRVVQQLLENGGLKQGFAGTEVILPEGLGPLEFRDVFSGRALRPKMRQGAFALDVGELFSIFPVTLLSRANG